MARVALGLGSNLGDKKAYLERALEMLSAVCQVRAVSTFHETEPVGYKEQGRFLNAAAVVETELEPRAFLQAAHAVERELGRERRIVNGPRTIDIDILLWEEQVIEEEGLRVPHPRMQERLFVLEPLGEVAAGWRHPRLGLTVGELFVLRSRQGPDGSAS
jgi:2-amino-4-hydroxy-6-hydroxymethyldihydropteridine diphosphokinase